jgi:serine/threonine-protein kinase
VVASSLVPVAVGETFERYEIESLIGRGGMGEVYRAVDTRLRRKVALKVLRPDRDNAEAVARLFREARSAAGLTHPNTVAIHDIGEAEGIFYIVMELVTGVSLGSYVGDVRVPAARKLGWLVDVARALSAAHRAGVIHRDVKPSNVMISEEGAVKVLDFGLAKPLAPVSFRTQQGHVLGTPRYMAPEQLAGADVDARSDQYAFALTAYELVAGKHPGGALAGTFVPPRLDEAMPEISRAVGDVIARAMSIESAHRFASMDDVAIALADAMAGRPLREHAIGDADAPARDASEVTGREAPPPTESVARPDPAAVSLSESVVMTDTPSTLQSVVEAVDPPPAPSPAADVGKPALAAEAREPAAGGLPVHTLMSRRADVDIAPAEEEPPELPAARRTAQLAARPPTTSRWLLFMVVIVVIGLCAFAGAYYGSKALS